MKAMTRAQKEYFQSLQKRRDFVKETVRPLFGSSPEEKLLCEIVMTAIDDCASYYLVTRRSAYQYLNGEMEHASLAGVEPDWIRRLLVKLEMLPRKGG